MTMEKVEVVVVGAGLAGLATAYCLAEAGIEVIVVERGDWPGSKNVTGGRLYLNPLHRYFPADLWDDAPFERPVVKERLTMMAEHASTTLELTSERFREKPHSSQTLLRAKFDQWLADKARDKGALIITKNKVDDLIRRDGRIIGIQSPDTEIQADVVVLADGALSFLVEGAGLRGRHQPKHFAVGVKEVVELPAKTIEDRFGLNPDEGAAQLFFGSLTFGMLGGGFLYTNRESLSLGLVVGIEALMKHQPPLEVPELIETFKARPEIQALIAGGSVVEYSAHIVPEGGLRAIPKLFTDSVVVVGDAAGFALNMGLTVRGMDFALASGAMAAQAIRQARQRKDFSAASLAEYETLLRQSFVLRDLHTFKGMLEVLDNQRLFARYPEAACRLFEDLMWIGEEPKGKLSATVIRTATREFLKPSVIRDIIGWLRV
jgi:electron transfer flavoprotein-quinone oxidoreductase